MGLDMYLFRRLRNKHPNSPKDKEAAYWRKANQIHQWFVKNVQDGVDDCEIHNEVTRDVLEELLDTCRIVAEDPSRAEELLPSQSGFFFGSTAYDEGYFLDITDTIEILERVIEETNFETEMIYYLSWW